MVMIEIAISEFKARCLAILEQVRRSRQPVRITRHGKPVAEVVPPAPITERSKMMGSMKDRAVILGDIVSPVSDEDDWEVLRD
jgi:prevent-host-death family protein